MQKLKLEIAAVVSRYLISRGVPERDADVLSLFKRPEKESFGDLSLPCFPFARHLKQAPPAIAGELVPLLTGITGIADVDVVGGYLNVHFDKLELFKSLWNRYQDHPDTFFHSSDLEGKTITVEFSSPNIAKPFSIGHLRSTVIGNFLQNLLRCAGANVVAINHLGDWGTQFGKLIVAFRKWGDASLLQDKPVDHLLDLYVRFHEEAETETTLEDEAREAFRLLEEGNPEEAGLWEQFRQLSLDEFNRVYDRLNVSFDHYLGEAFYRDKLDKVIRTLTDANLLTESQNAMIVDLEDHDMPPCLIQKSDGASLYATRDIAAAMYRHEAFQFDRSLYVVGAEQSLHFKQFFKVLELAGCDWASGMEHIPFGLYRFKDGKMSTRKGKVVFLEDVLNEAVTRVRAVMDEKDPDLTATERMDVAEKLGTSAIIFNDLKNDRVKDIQFAWDEVLNLEGDSGPYIAYSYVRCRGILDKAAHVSDTLPDSLANMHPAEVTLVQKLTQFTDILSLCVRHRKSHFLAQYLLELTRMFHGFYHHCRVVGEDPDVSAFRKALVRMTAATLKAGCGLMCMKLPERM